MARYSSRLCFGHQNDKEPTVLLLKNRNTKRKRVHAFRIFWNSEDFVDIVRILTTIFIPLVSIDIQIEHGTDGGWRKKPKYGKRGRRLDISVLCWFTTRYFGFWQFFHAVFRYRIPPNAPKFYIITHDFKVLQLQFIVLSWILFTYWTSFHFFYLILLKIFSLKS